MVQLLFPLALLCIIYVRSAEVIATLNLGFQSESIEYDGINNVFWVTDSHSINGDGNVASITSNMSLIIENKPNLKNPALSNGNDYKLVTGSGIVSTGNHLFVCDQSTGNITQYDIEMGVAINAIHIDNVFGEPSQLDGLCVDYKSNKNILYTTSPGIDFREQVYTNAQGIWSVDIENGKTTNIYNIHTSLPNDYKLHPNGCVVVDDVLYAVDTRLDKHGAFIIYDITNDILTYNKSIFNISGDGLTFDYQHNIFYASSSTGYQLQSIYQYNPNVMDRFESLIHGFRFPAAISFDDKHNVIAIPELFTRQFEFVQV